MRLNKTYLIPSEIQTLKPQQQAVVVNYCLHNGKEQVWMICDDHPYNIFVIPTKAEGFTAENIIDALDNHFDNIVVFPSQRQFIKDYQIKSIMIKDYATRDLDIKKSIASRVIGLLGKIISVGVQIIALAAKDILALVSFTGKNLLKIFQIKKKIYI